MINFGNDENNLYRIVSHETSGLTKITSAEPLKNNGNFVALDYGSNSVFVNTNSLVRFLMTTYQTDYISSEQYNMIEPITTWYYGTVGNGVDYRLAKYTDASMTSTTTSAIEKVGLLRFGELMTSQTARFAEGDIVINENTVRYWLINSYDGRRVAVIIQNGTGSSSYSTTSYGVKPALNLKSNVIITGGTGLKNDPFQIELESTS